MREQTVYDLRLAHHEIVLKLDRVLQEGVEEIMHEERRGQRKIHRAIE